MIQIKPILTLLFVVLLPDWVHFASNQLPPTSEDPYDYFVCRLAQVIDASPPEILPFSLKARVIQDWLQTSNEFKDLCLRCESKLRHLFIYTPVMALTETINRTFHHYIYSANTNLFVLQSIKSVDPVGFIAYLTQKNVTISSPDFMPHAVTFQATMKQRVRLLNMRTNNSCFDIFEGSSSIATSNFLSSISIPPVARNEIATEYGPLSDESIDPFTDLFSEKKVMKMYRVGAAVDEYQEHFSAETDDVQILHGTLRRQQDNWTTVRLPPHLICVRYQASYKKVFVYGKMKYVKLDERQRIIIHKLYPFGKEIVFDSRSALADKHPASGIFAIMYATILLHGLNPATHTIKLNEVWGDETLYLRIHILNMLANRKMALLN